MVTNNKLQKNNQTNNQTTHNEYEEANPLFLEENQLFFEVDYKLDLLAKGQEGIKEDIRSGFVGLALRNEKLLKLNEELKKQSDEIFKELNAMKQEREEKAARKATRVKRKRLPKRDPMTAEIYKKLIQAAEGPTYRDVRLRLALCILAVTGVRISELLPLKVFQLKTLVDSYWIAIDRSKQGPSNHKAFLTNEGKKIIKDRQKNFEFISLMKSSDAYIFTTEANHFKMLTRELITRDVNKIMHSVSNQLDAKPNITSHSFRIGYITQLWKNSKDIEFVKQSIGHRNLNTTSSYVRELSDEDRQQRMEKISSK